MHQETFRVREVFSVARDPSLPWNYRLLAGNTSRWHGERGALAVS
jgi:hypothetical protein